MNLGFYQEYDKRKHKDLGKYKMDFLKSIIVLHPSQPDLQLT